MAKGGRTAWACWWRSHQSSDTMVLVFSGLDSELSQLIPERLASTKTKNGQERLTEQKQAKRSRSCLRFFWDLRRQPVCSQLAGEPYLGVINLSRLFAVSDSCRSVLVHCHATAVQLQCNRKISMGFLPMGHSVVYLSSTIKKPLAVDAD